MLRLSARPGLLSGRFRHGGVDVDEQRWSPHDANDPEVRATLLAYVPSHIRVAPGSDRELAAAGLELAGGQLVDARAIATAKAVDDKAKDKTPLKSAPKDK